MKMYKIPKNSLENSNLSIKVLEILASNKGDFEELFDIFAILENQDSQSILYLEKLKNLNIFVFQR